MSAIKLQGVASGSGLITFVPTATNSDRTVTLPDASGTILLSGGAISGTTGTFTDVTISGTLTGGLPGPRAQVFTSSGTFTIPSGVTAIKITVVGGGGGSGNSGSGGGGGGAAIKFLTGLTPSNTLSVTVGAAGGTSSVASGTQSITTVSATGGAAGTSGGSGGIGSNGDLNIGGQSGIPEQSFTTYGCQVNTVSGGGGSSILGGGGKLAQAGRAYGGGGGGSGNNAGAAGVVLIEY